MSQITTEQLDSASNSIAELISQLSQENISLLIMLLGGGSIAIATIYALSYFVKNLNSP